MPTQNQTDITKKRYKTPINMKFLLLAQSAALVFAFAVQTVTAFVSLSSTVSSSNINLHVNPPFIRKRTIAARPTKTSLNVVQNADAIQEGELFPLAQEIFPNAITYNEMLNYITKSLLDTGFDIPKTLLGTSLCCDELNRPLEQLLAKIFDTNYSLGGMAGCPFGGVTSFRKLKLHIPDGGNAVIVYGSHVGVGTQGQVGSVERKRKEEGDLCCRSAILASEYVSHVYHGGTPDPPPMDPSDISQYYVQNMLQPHAERLEHSTNKMVELPYVLYEEQLQLLRRIIKEGSEAGFPGTVAVFGGIQLNTPPGYVDYFVPLNGDLYGEDGEILSSFF